MNSLLAIDIIKDLYQSYVLGDDKSILHIYINQNILNQSESDFRSPTKVFYDSFLQLIEPSDLKSKLTFKFTDEADSIKVEGNRDDIELLVKFLDNLVEGFKKQDLINIQNLESPIKEFLNKKGKFKVNEDYTRLADYNIHVCMRCGYTSLWARGFFPLQQPFMCPQCGSYTVTKNYA